MSRIANVIRMATSRGVVDFNNQQEVQITKTKGSIQWKKPTLDQQAIRTNNHTRATFVKELCKQMGCSEIVKEKLEKMLVTNSGKPLTLSTAKKESLRLLCQNGQNRDPQSESERCQTHGVERERQDRSPHRLDGKQ